MRGCPAVVGVWRLPFSGEQFHAYVYSRCLGHDFQGIASFATVANEEKDFVQQLSYTTSDISR